MATQAAYGILVPQPEIESALPALETQHLNHWTTRDVQGLGILKNKMPDWVLKADFKCSHLINV